MKIAHGYTDKIKISKIKKDPNRVSEVATGWSDRWDQIMKGNPQVQITLHAPID
jgi:hypothetical protein